MCQARASSAAAEAPWAKAKRWIDEGDQEGVVGAGEVAVRWSRRRRRRAVVLEGLGLGITAAVELERGQHDWSEFAEVVT